MTIEQYLHGKVDFNLEDATIAAILYDRGVSEGSAMADVTDKERDLCLADLYMFVATSSSTTSGESESDGGWQRKKASKNVVNRGDYRKMAQTLYEKWSVSAETSTGKITSKPLY